MPRRKISILLGATLLGAASLPSLAWSQGIQAAPPPLTLTTHVLANGLKVIFAEDHSVPIVNVQVWYHVGSKDEAPGRSGFAHLFEHIMFKGSANVSADEYNHFIESIGGSSNATTDTDRTIYYETVPSQHLERILWMEADRLASLDISEAKFHSERDVVKEERRLRIDNPPYGRLYELMFGKSYTVHPYRILPIGSMADLDAATLEDVRAFHAKFYVPSNATLIVSGDFEPSRTLAWAKKHFGPIPAGAPIVRQIPPEPAQTAERRAVEYDAKAPLPAVLITYHVPEGRHPDLYALRIAAQVLSGGDSSRIYRSLVYDKQMAVFAGGQLVPLEDPGLFNFSATLQAGQKPEDGEKALLAEVARLQQEPISAEELDKAKNQTIVGLLNSRQTVAFKGVTVGTANLIFGDPQKVNGQVDAFQKVTAADVERVARRYFTPENRTVIYMLPESQRPAAATAASTGGSR
jgi:zinc protease